MSKRIKRVFTNANEVLHRWANQIQDSARCRNVFFEGRSCYSYGYHYELGRLIDYNGHTIAMINTIGYSNTTSKHIHHALSACSHMITLTTEGNWDVEESLLNWQGQILTGFMDHFTQLKFWSGSDYDKESDSWFQSALQKFNHAASILGHAHLQLLIPDDWWELRQEHINERRQRAIELSSPEHLAKLEMQRARREELAAEKKRRELAGAIKRFMAGESVYPRGLRPQIIRVKGDLVQTSDAASVTLPNARRLLMAYDSGLDLLGYEIDGFKVTVIDRANNRIKIGCHALDVNQCREVLLAHGPALKLVNE